MLFSVFQKKGYGILQIGISTACFYSRMFTEEALKVIGSFGASVCEVFLDSYCEYEPDFADLLAQTAQEQGLKIVSMHAMSSQFEPQLFALGQRQREDANQLFLKVLKAGERLGARNYVLHGPATLRGALKNADLERIGPIASRLADIAADYGIRLCWENVSWCLFHEPQFAQQIVEHCHSSNLYFTLDIKQAIRAGYDPLAFLATMGSRIAHVHLCDYKKNEQGALSLEMPGQGNFDFGQLSRELNAIGYRGDAILEVYSDGYDGLDEVFEGWKHLKSIMC